jgi:adenylate cyclase
MREAADPPRPAPGTTIAGPTSPPGARSGDGVVRGPTGACRGGASDNAVGMDAGRMGQRLVAINLAANVVGAVLTFLYFRVVDYTPEAERVRVTAPELAFFVVGLGVLAGAGYALGSRWTRGLTRAAAGRPGSPPPELRRRALLLPWVFAGITLSGWLIAGVVWGVAWPALAGTLTFRGAVRSMFGITCIAGTVTVALVFFAIEHQWRRVLPAFFPEGDLASVRDTLRLPVRVRLLVIVLLASVIPLAVLGVLAFTRAAAIRGADPETAADLVRAILLLTVFVLVVGVVTASGLAVYASGSVATPLALLTAAMAEVARGRLDARAPVLGNDELGAAAEGFNRMVDGLREREVLRETFGKYVTPEIRDEILAGRVQLEGQTVEATLLFCDLRDFTPWVERTDPRVVVRDLNAYFSEMDAAIRAHQGLVLQFIGDEIEAVFGAPVPAPHHADDAVRAAVEMRRRLADLNAARRRDARPPLRHGIGIHTGVVLAGNIGSADRLAYALVGDAVNLASRIQALTKDAGADILLTAATRRRLIGAWALEALPATHVKGKADEVEVFRVR